MAMSEDGRRRAGRYAEKMLGERRKDRTWLVDMTSLDPATVADFLDGKRWPRTGSRNAIEAALGIDQGTLKDVADGWGQVDPGMDPVERAIEESSTLSRGQKLRLRGLYVDMIEEQEASTTG